MSNLSLMTAPPNKKMKVLLIYPYFLHARVHSIEDIRVVPQGLHYIAALLKENQYEVEVLNWYNIHETPEMIETVLQNQQPTVIGFSILHANRWGVLRLPAKSIQALKLCSAALAHHFCGSIC